MAILKGYGVGSPRNLLAFIKRIWDGDTLALVSKQEGFFGVPFDVLVVGRGVRCGR
jgi:hypothetical protein